MARQTFSGLVISTGKMNKTIKVRVQRIVFNRVISKNIVKYRDFLVHDELNVCKEGDVVKIQYVRPLSTRKSFAVIEIMRDKGTEFTKYKEEAPGIVAKEELQKLEEYKLLRQKKLEANGVDLVTEGLEQINLAELSRSGPSDETTDIKIEAIKQKYGIKSWPPTPDMLETDGAKLKAELHRLDIILDKGSFSKYVADILENQPERAAEILTSLGKDAATLSKSVKKNILMKHFSKSYSS
jgi:small subunit ribosomal protein S17